MKKLQDRASKAKDEVQKTRDKYENALEEINEYNSKYIEEMTAVFNKCQDFEEKRMKFFIETLFSIHRCLDISKMPELVRIYEEYRHTIQNADPSKDLKYWSNTFGVGMAMNWPIFEVFIYLGYCLNVINQIILRSVMIFDFTFQSRNINFFQFCLVCFFLFALCFPNFPLFWTL